jgi:hypothetical protein
MEHLALAAEDHESVMEMLRPFQTNPPAFIRDRDPLSEFLAMSTLTAKAKTDEYLLPQEDSCSVRPLYQCEIDQQCKVYKEKCVSPSRIKPFRELSKEMGNRIQGKFTFEPFDFIIHDSGRYYRLIISMTTKRLYVLFNSGSYVHNFEDFNLPQLIDTILKTDKDFSVVLCGHSQGGAIALHCAERMVTDHLPFFKERCTVISLAPFPALETDILFSKEVRDCKNIHVYFTAVQTNGHVYVDPWYFENVKKRKHYVPFTLLLLDKTVKEVVTEDFHPTNDRISERFNHSFFDSLHSLSMYLNFFHLRTIAGGRRKSRRSIRSRRSKTTNRPSRKVIVR